MQRPPQDVPLRRRPPSWRHAALALVALARPAVPDTVVTEDGRVLEDVKVREHEESYTLTFKNGTIDVPRSMVAEVSIEGDMSDYAPRNEDEAQKLAQGFVKYRGRWVGKAAYQAELNRRNEERRARLAERELRTNFANAWEKETKHFLVRTNTSPALLEHYAELLETYYDLMDERIGIKPSPTLRRARMTVNIYKSRAEFVKLNKAKAGPAVLGYFWPQDQTLNFFHDYQDPGRSEQVALHECTHLLTYLVDPQFVPAVKSIWINEGVADLFGSSDVIRDGRGRLVITPGKLLTDRVLTVQQAIKDGNDTTLEQLIRLPPEDFDAFQYAHAWSFLYFLTQKSPAYDKAFWSFFKDIYALQVEKKEVYEGPDKSGVAYVIPPDEVRRLLLKKLGQKDTETLEREWKDFIAGIPLEAPEARFKRAYRTVRFGAGMGADRAANARAREQALADLDFALANGFVDARAYWARGQLKAYGYGDFEAGGLDFKRAIALDPLNPAYRFDAAQALCGHLFALSVGDVEIRMAGDRDLLGTDDELSLAKQEFGLAAELDKSNDFYAETFDEYCALYAKHQSQ
jgi:hypothetical protein